MFRSTLIAAGAVLLCSTGYSQQQIDPAKIHPIMVPVRDAGVFNWSTQKWVKGPRAQRLKATPYTVFRNDCHTFNNFGYYGVEHCEDILETGRLPSTSTPLSSLAGANTPYGAPMQLNGVTDDQYINSFQFAYCTYWVTGTVDIKIGFYDNLRGQCASGLSIRGKPYNLTLQQQAVQAGTHGPIQRWVPGAGTGSTHNEAYFDFSTANGTGRQLPGSTTNGDQSCWSVTVFMNNGFCMQSEGDGVWNNDLNQDLFGWTFQHDMPNSTYGPGTANGPLIRGEPKTGGWGAGAYNLPTGTDAINGNQCGTGFGGLENEAWWLNTDGVAAPATSFSTILPSGNCRAASGTGCYWFGGWPGTALGSFWMVMGSTRGACSDCNNRPVAYCTAGTTASGCNGVISAQGTSSQSAATGFFLLATGYEGNKSGLFFYGTNGRQANQWSNTTSFQCVVPPVRRTPLQAQNGTNGACDGNAKIDLNAQWQIKPNTPMAGQVVQAQFWFRDPQVAGGTTSLTDAVEWTVCP